MITTKKISNGLQTYTPVIFFDCLDGDFELKTAFEDLNFGLGDLIKFAMIDISSMWLDTNENIHFEFANPISFTGTNDTVYILDNNLDTHMFLFTNIHGFHAE